mmetsp:Transcript_24701/g.48449  ORF Transcript_24701/g.48449 Transcript_24701/m.48449 type:complete len:113 (-) Transcript_24701:1634-1972(-)
MSEEKKMKPGGVGRRRSHKKEGKEARHHQSKLPDRLYQTDRQTAREAGRREGREKRQRAIKRRSRNERETVDSSDLVSSLLLLYHSPSLFSFLPSFLPAGTPSSLSVLQSSA